MRVYMLVTADEYELPLAVRDTAVEIAELLGWQTNEVFQAVRRKSVSQEKYNGFRYKIIKIKVDDEEDENHD